MSVISKESLDKNRPYELIKKSYIVRSKENEYWLKICIDNEPKQDAPINFDSELSIETLE